MSLQAPGVRYLINVTPQLVIPPLAVYLLRYVLQSRLGYSFPIWLTLLAYSFSWAIAFTVLVQAVETKKRIEAAAHGARLTPVTEAKYPGNIDVVLKTLRNDGGRIIAHMSFELQEKYGSVFNCGVLFEDRVFTSEPDYIKMILSTEFNSYEKGPYFRGQMQSVLGTGVFNTDGEMWKFHRGISRPFFSRDRISHFHIFDRYAEDALGRMQERFNQGYAIDWQDLIARFTMDSATEFLFGTNVKSLEAGLPYPPTSAAGQAKRPSHPADRFSMAFLYAQQLSGRRSRFLGMWPLMEFWKDRVEKHMRVVNQFIDPLIEEALRSKGEKQPISDETISDEETLLGHLVQVTDDMKIIRDEAINILLAGRDTTASTLTFAVYKLSEHPDVIQRLREEILATVGPTRAPTYEDIKDMKYLRAFINEVLRLYPPVPVNVRATTKATLWPSKVPGEKPFYLPAGTRCQYSVFVMHRRKDLWGPDALDFDPDRFLDERLAKYLVPNPFIFLPFNAGPRICLGQQFAYNEMSFILIRLLQKYSSIELAPEAEPRMIAPPSFAESPGSNGSDRIHMRSHITLYATHGLWVKMTPATQSETA